MYIVAENENLRSIILALRNEVIQIERLGIGVDHILISNDLVTRFFNEMESDINNSLQIDPQNCKILGIPVRMAMPKGEYSLSDCPDSAFIMVIPTNREIRKADKKADAVEIRFAGAGIEAEDYEYNLKLHQREREMTFVIEPNDCVAWKSPDNVDGVTKIMDKIDDSLANDTSAGRPEAPKSVYNRPGPPPFISTAQQQRFVDETSDQLSELAAKRNPVKQMSEQICPIGCLPEEELSNVQERFVIIDHIMAFFRKVFHSPNIDS